MVLVTGASGFLGQHLVQYLSARGTSVRALFHSSPPGPELTALPGVQWLQCDLLDVFAIEEAMEGITTIYHCAAVISFSKSGREQMMHFNTESTANLVNQALLQPGCRLVHVSSVAALGRTNIKGKQITEEEEWGESRYNSAYGISKYIAEMEVWRAIGEGLDAVIVNPGIILGAVPAHCDAARLMSMAHAEFPYYTEGVNAWVDVADVVKAMAALAGSGITAERFIISSGNYSYRDIFSKMARALGKKPPRYKADAFIAGMAWRLSALKNKLTGKKQVLTRETANNAMAVCLYNNSKLLQALPDLTYTPIDTTISIMARSFRPFIKK